MFTQSPVDNIVDKIRELVSENGDGFSIYADTGLNLEIDGVWLVGGVIPSIILSSSQALSDVYAEVGSWYRGASIVSENPIVGAWVQDGFIHLDLVTIVYSAEDAQVLGKIWRQEAVGCTNSGTFSELKVG